MDQFAVSFIFNGDIRQEAQIRPFSTVCCSDGAFYVLFDYTYPTQGSCGNSFGGRKGTQTPAGGEGGGREGDSNIKNEGCSSDIFEKHPILSISFDGRGFLPFKVRCW